jgi:hypothetical protein
MKVLHFRNKTFKFVQGIVRIPHGCIIKTIPWNYTALKWDWYSTDSKHKMDRI